MPMLAEYLNRFDPLTGNLDGATLVERRLSQLEGCFADTASYRATLERSDPVVYSVSALEPGNGEGDLHVGLGRIMPGRVGAEYYLTKGHLHAWRDASELYIGLTGKGLMLLEDEHDQARAVALEPNTLVYVPGHTAHRTINVGDVPLTYLGVYPARSGHDYGAIADRNFSQVVIHNFDEPTVMSRRQFLETLQPPTARP